jgi:hypothetical protein
MLPTGHPGCELALQAAQLAVVPFACARARLVQDADQVEFELPYILDVMIPAADPAERREVRLTG